MDEKDTANELTDIDESEFNIFLDTLKEVFEEDIEKGIDSYER